MKTCDCQFANYEPISKKKNVLDSQGANEQKDYEPFRKFQNKVACSLLWEPKMLRHEIELRKQTHTFILQYLNLEPGNFFF